MIREKSKSDNHHEETLKLAEKPSIRDLIKEDQDGFQYIQIKDHIEPDLSKDQSVFTTAPLPAPSVDKESVTLKAMPLPENHSWVVASNVMQSTDKCPFKVKVVRIENIVLFRVIEYPSLLSKNYGTFVDVADMDLTRVKLVIGQGFMVSRGSVTLPGIDYISKIDVYKYVAFTRYNQYDAEDYQKMLVTMVEKANKKLIWMKENGVKKANIVPINLDNEP